MSPYIHECSDSYRLMRWRDTRIQHFRRFHAGEENWKTQRELAVWCFIGVGLFAVVLLFVGLTSSLAGAHSKAPPLNDVGREALRFCESTSRYDLVHLDVNNRYSMGAYQFQQGTWDVALHEMKRSGYEDSTEWGQWIGTQPNLAPHWVQDHAATFWWGAGNHTAWPHCHTVAIEAMILTPDKKVGGLRVIAPTPRFTG